MRGPFEAALKRGIGINSRQSEWTESISVGSELFIEELKEKLNGPGQRKECCWGRDSLSAKRAN